RTRATSGQSCWTIHSPRPSRASGATGARPTRASAGPGPWSATVMTTRSGPAQPRTTTRGRPCTRAYETVSLTVSPTSSAAWSRWPGAPASAWARRRASRTEGSTSSRSGGAALRGRGVPGDELLGARRAPRGDEDATGQGEPVVQLLDVGQHLVARRPGVVGAQQRDGGPGEHPLDGRLVAAPRVP